jgi:hypothetical protein
VAIPGRFSLTTKKGTTVEGDLILRAAGVPPSTNPVLASFPGSVTARGDLKVDDFAQVGVMVVMMIRRRMDDKEEEEEEDDDDDDADDDDDDFSTRWWTAPVCSPSATASRASSP